MSSPTPLVRESWLDVARAIALILVVSLHVVIGHYYLMGWAAMPNTAVWDRIDQVLSVVRLPLLFVCSGVLAAGKIHRGFRGGKSLYASITTYWLYALWFVVFMASMQLVPSWLDTPHAVYSFGEFAIQFVAPNTYLWYLYALAAYVVVFTAVRKVPVALVLGAAFALHVVSAGLWGVTDPLWTRIPTYAVFFALGAFWKPFWTYAAHHWWIGAASLVPAYMLFNHITLKALMSEEHRDPFMAIQVAALYLLAGFVAISASGLLARISIVAKISERVGQHNLAVYVLHIPVIVVVNIVTLGPAKTLVENMSHNELWHAVYPAVVSLVVVLTCVLLGSLLKKVNRSAGLFNLPEPLEKKALRLDEKLRQVTTDAKKRVLVRSSW